MQKRNGKYLYSPSDLINFMESEFVSWMNRCDLDFPGKFSKDGPDEELEIFARKGIEFEKTYLNRLKNEGHNVFEIGGSGDPEADTHKAMKLGVDFVYQATLRHENFAGYSDFLHKMPGKSNFGDFYYEPWDTKLALKAKPYFIIQLCCYAELLESLQGIRSPEIGVVLRDGETRRFKTHNFYYFYLALKEAFLKQMDVFDPNRIPQTIGNDDYKHWNGYVEEMLKKSDHLIRIANIRVSQIKKLKDAGIETLTGLANTTLPRIPKMDLGTFEKLKKQAQLQLASKDKPVYELIPSNPEDPRRGLYLLPPLSQMDIFFDMEGYTLVEDGLEYLFGFTHRVNGETSYIDFWAHNRDGEKKAFEDFVDYVFQKFKQDSAMHIYHYGVYEVAALRRLAQRHGTREEDLDHLLRNEVFVDLYKVVSQGMMIGEPGYSIKNLERFYGEKRSGDVKTAGASMVYYQRWLEEQDGSSWEDSKLLQEIRNYNRDDCVSTLQLADWLRGVQAEKGISFIDDTIQNEEPPRELTESEKLAQKMFSEIPADRSGDPEKWRIHSLLAHLLLFHWREAKPVYWAMFDRHEMVEEELIEDINCLGGLRRTATPGLQDKKSFIYEYEYNPDQDTKISEGDRCLIAHDLSQKPQIEYLDADRGVVRIKLGPSAHHPPPSCISLIPDEIISGKTIADSIFRVVSDYLKAGTLPSALADFLYRRQPRVTGNQSGPLIRAGVSIVEGAIESARRLENSTLCIQGPPGAGKTFTACKIILDLIQNGKKIGITANSHKAISHLMTKLAEEAEKNKVTIRGTKIGNDEQDALFKFSSMSYIKDPTTYFKSSAGQFQVVGGTAWLFSRLEATNSFDYLVVDEAGQVSLANLVGISPCTKNLILLGDQMQLAQPIQGTHPEESGLSVLDYLLRDHATIPEDMGIFLSTTHRMHPEVCSFISEMVYEGRLHPEAHTANQNLQAPGAQRVKKGAGVLFLPVEHEGNQQASDEEVDLILEITKELLTATYRDFDGKTKALTLQDILYVAPYNMQVRKIQQALGPGARVGSVDRFQGQEAPVVVMSMCSSDGNASPRGIEFLFNKNRLNVAISRAKCLAIVVGNPALARTNCSTIAQMEMVNLFCRIVRLGCE